MNTRFPSTLQADQSVLGGESPKLYHELAAWWPLLSAPADYADEAAFFRQTFLTACHGPLQTLLELGSGGGNVASHLKAHFQLILVDRAAAMLAVSGTLNPECAHVEGDMRSVRLVGRRFDGVLIHDAIMYMTTEHDLAQAMETCFIHCRPGGVSLFVPDCVRETFRPTMQHGAMTAEAAACATWSGPGIPTHRQHLCGGLCLSVA